MFSIVKSKNLEIAKLGEAVLRLKAVKVTNIQDKKVQTLISDMLDTVKNSNGVGLAAPQVFESLQILIISSKPNDRYPHAPQTDPIVIINPTIIETSSSKNKDWEGCLSIPGIRALVSRFDMIKVKYTNEKNEQKIEIFEDFIARVFQHEYDHLNGLVYLDRIDSTEDIVSEEVYFKLTS